MACFINQRAIFISYKYTSTIWNRSDIIPFLLYDIAITIYMYDLKSRIIFISHAIYLYKKLFAWWWLHWKNPSQMTILPLHQSCLKVDNLSRENILWNGRKIRMRDEENIAKNEPICGNICKGQLLDRPCRL